MSMAEVRPAIVRLPNSDFSSPQCRLSETETVSPRVFFGSSATSSPPILLRWVRASIFSCVGRNTSAVSTRSRGLKSFITSATVGAAAITARCGWSSGMNMPTTRLSRRK
jgi:hypothetical protein